MMDKAQVHINIAEDVWERLVEGTVLWPDRSMQTICRYALSELFNDMCEPDEDVPVPPPVERGDFHVQVRSSGPDEVAQWMELAAQYGSKALALRVALALLLRSLEWQDEEEEVEEEEVEEVVEVDDTDVEEVVAAEISGTEAFLRLLAEGWTQAEIIRATGIDSGSASRAKQGKANLGPRYTERLREAFPNAFK